jgi:hypothetical protein
MNILEKFGSAVLSLKAPKQKAIASKATKIAPPVQEMQRPFTESQAESTIVGRLHTPFSATREATISGIHDGKYKVRIGSMTLNVKVEANRVELLTWFYIPPGVNITVLETLESNKAVHPL